MSNMDHNHERNRAVNHDRQGAEGKNAGPETTSGAGREEIGSAAYREGQLSGQPHGGSESDRAGPNEASEAEALEGAWYQLGFGIARSLRYHAKRRSFFERCNHLTRAFLAISSAGAVVTILNGHHMLAVGLGAAIAIATSFDLVFDFSTRAMKYDTLYKKFADLGIKVAGADRTAENCRIFRVEQLIIERDEPTTLAVLNVICSNEELAARGFDYRYRIRIWQKMLCEAFDVGPFKFEQISAPELQSIQI